MIRTNGVLLGSLALGLLLVAGCAPDGPALPTVPVTGKVTYKGEPVEGAMVGFISTQTIDGKAANGVTKADGTYTLETYLTPTNKPQGALPGDYRIMITKTQGGGESSEDMRLRMEGVTADVDASKAKDFSQEKSKEIQKQFESQQAPNVEKFREGASQSAPPNMTDMMTDLPMGDGGGEREKSLLPVKYANVSTSELERTVTEAGPNVFDFELTD